MIASHFLHLNWYTSLSNSLEISTFNIGKSHTLQYDLVIASPLYNTTP